MPERKTKKIETSLEPRLIRLLEKCPNLAQVLGNMDGGRGPKVLEEKICTAQKSTDDLGGASMVTIKIGCKKIGHGQLYFGVEITSKNAKPPVEGFSQYRDEGGNLSSNPPGQITIDDFNEPVGRGEIVVMPDRNKA